MHWTLKTLISLAFPSLHCCIKVSFCTVSSICPLKTVSPSTSHILHDLKLSTLLRSLHPWFCSLPFLLLPLLKQAFSKSAPTQPAQGMVSATKSGWRYQLFQFALFLPRSTLFFYRSTRPALLPQTHRYPSIVWHRNSFSKIASHQPEGGRKGYTA